MLHTKQSNLGGDSDLQVQKDIDDVLTASWKCRELSELLKRIREYVRTAGRTSATDDEIRGLGNDGFGASEQAKCGEEEEERDNAGGEHCGGDEALSEE